MEAFDLLRPRDLASAMRVARGPQTAYIAGGTDLMQLLKDNIENPTRLIDLDHVLDSKIVMGSQFVRIGALATMTDVAAHPDLIRHFPVVSQALLASAAPQLRNMATVGGNLLQRTRCSYFRDVGFPCNKRVAGSGCPALKGENRNLAILGGSTSCIATNASDLAVSLVALDAELEVHAEGGSTRRVKLVDFHRLPGDTPHIETVLQPGEIIAAIEIPAHPIAPRSGYLKLRDRASFEFALVSAAVALDVEGGVIREARIAMGGVATKPWRAEKAEAALRGEKPGEDLFRHAAGLVTEGANPASQNQFKVTLVQRAVARALSTVAA